MQRREGGISWKKKERKEGRKGQECKNYEN
jgi:hypothetical protein